MMEDILAARVKELVEILGKARKAIDTLMSCNEISRAADIIGEETITEIDKLLGANTK